MGAMEEQGTQIRVDATINTARGVDLGRKENATLVGNLEMHARLPPLLMGKRHNEE
jgi:hypothetical protein